MRKRNNNVPNYAVTLHKAFDGSVMFKLTSASGIAVALFSVMSGARVTFPTMMENNAPVTRHVSALYAVKRACRYLAHIAQSVAPCAMESLFCDSNGVPQHNITIRIPNEFTVPKGKRNYNTF